MKENYTFNMSVIWDAHNHWMPSEVAEATTFFKKGWSDIDALLRSLDESGVEKALLLYPTSDAHLKMGGWSKVCALYNKALANKVKEYPDRLIGAGILPVDSPDEMLSEIERIKELGLSSLSLASSYEGKYLDHEIFLPVLERAEKEDLPIFVHSQIINPIGYERIKDPLLMPVVEYLFDITMCVGRLMMSETFNKFKDLKCIFAHFGGVLPFLTDRFDATYGMLRSRNIVKDLKNLPSQILKNCYVDTSGVKSASMLSLALECFGPKRILWGSDFPAKKDLSQSIKVLDALSVQEKDKENILGSNLIRLFEKGA